MSRRIAWYGTSLMDIFTRCGTLLPHPRLDVVKLLTGIHIVDWGGSRPQVVLAGIASAFYVLTLLVHFGSLDGRICTRCSLTICRMVCAIHRIVVVCGVLTYLVLSQ